MAKIVTYYVGKDMIFYSYAISFLRERGIKKSWVRPSVKQMKRDDQLSSRFFG